MAASISAIRLSGSVVATGNFKVSRSQDLGLFLVHAKGSLLGVWHHRIGSNGVGDWVQVGDTIHVREACNRGEEVSVLAVDDNAEFVLLELMKKSARARLVCVHVKSRMEEVYEDMPRQLPVRGKVFPFMMVWPPIFPALKEEHDQQE